MKKLILSLVAIATISLSSFGQAPEGFKYQAVVRDAGNLILNNQAVGMQMTIQQGSIGGTTVYQERFTITTNGYGLVNLAIGNGTVVSGDFTTIDWANGPYFMETAVDVNGGSNYAVMGTSQLMSVPYALHANTAESISGITALDIANWNNDTDTQLDSTGVSALGFVAGVHTIDTDTQLDSTGVATLGFVAGAHTIDTDTDTQLDSTGVVALGFVAGAHTIDTDTQLDSTAIANMGFVASTGTCGLSIGDWHAGGIIFYLDGTGCSGLVAAPTDMSTGAEWGCYGTPIAGADGTAIGTGSQNTIDIEAGCTTNGTAADLCSNYTDWFLPSKDELNLMYQNIGPGNALGLGNVGGFATLDYWSSTEFDNYGAWGQNFNAGNQGNVGKDYTFYVRAVRAF
jgi:hypothetical protein